MGAAIPVAGLTMGADLLVGNIGLDKADAAPLSDIGVKRAVLDRERACGGVEQGAAAGVLAYAAEACRPSAVLSSS